MAEKHLHRQLSAVRRYKERLVSRNLYRSRLFFQSSFKVRLLWVGRVFAGALRFAFGVKERIDNSLLDRDTDL